MGFPTWTLIGMGLTFSLALIMVILAFIAQSPGMASKLGLAGARLDLRLKSFTGYALALMLLSLGFFIAGVPLDPSLTETAVNPTPTPTATNLSQEPIVIETAVITPTLTVSETISAADFEQTPSSGAFGGPPPDQGEPIETETEADPAVTVIPSATNTATPVTHTPTATATPTATPTSTPTITPTPIDGPTAVLDLAGGVVWLYRSPGGQTLIVLQDQEVVILRNGYANRAGILWREVSAGDGTIGWVEESFLTYPEAEE